MTEALPSSPASLRERIDHYLLLNDASTFWASAVHGQWVNFLEYSRRYQAKGPLDFVTGYSHFLRYSWGLGGRREIVPVVLRGLWRRMLGRGRGAHPHGGDAELGQP